MGFLKRIRAAKAQLHPGPYRVEVRENIGLSGYGTTKYGRYRVVVWDANGVPIKTMYGMTFRTAHKMGRDYAAKLEAAAPSEGEAVGA